MSTTTGAWSDGEPVPWAGSRSSRSMNAPVTRPASEGEQRAKSILRPRSRSKRGSRHGYARPQGCTQTLGAICLERGLCISTVISLAASPSHLLG